MTAPGCCGLRCYWPALVVLAFLAAHITLGFVRCLRFNRRFRASTWKPAPPPGSVGEVEDPLYRLLGAVRRRLACHLMTADADGGVMLLDRVRGEFATDKVEPARTERLLRTPFRLMHDEPSDALDALRLVWMSRATGVALYVLVLWPSVDRLDSLLISCQFALEGTQTLLTLVSAAEGPDASALPDVMSNASATVLGGSSSLGGDASSPWSPTALVALSCGLISMMLPALLKCYDLICLLFSRGACLSILLTACACALPSAGIAGEVGEMSMAQGVGQDALSAADEVGVAAAEYAADGLSLGEAEEGGGSATEHAVSGLYAADEVGVAAAEYAIDGFAAPDNVGGGVDTSVDTSLDGGHAQGGDQQAKEDVKRQQSNERVEGAMSSQLEGPPGPAVSLGITGRNPAAERVLAPLNRGQKRDERTIAIL